MRNIMYGVLSASLLIFAWWAYKENYRTQDRQRTLEELQRLHGERFYYLQYLNADWAHLTRAERLTALVEDNFNQINLGPMTESNLVMVETIPYVKDQHDRVGLLAFSDESGTGGGFRPR